jgi:hypothetical protein
MMSTFLQGAVTMGCLLAGLFFLRFWRDSRDRLFVLFALAFWMLGISYVLLTFAPLSTDWRPDVFVTRLIAFCLILSAIADKNRR